MEDERKKKKKEDNWLLLFLSSCSEEKYLTDGRQTSGELVSGTWVYASRK